jgi:SSS family solute:Na+ symporter
VSPGALAIFLLGFFWKRATANGALLAAFGTFVFSLLLKAALPQIPFLDRMMLVFALCVLVMVVSALIEKRPADTHTLATEPGMFATSLGFKVTSALIVGVLAVIYSVWW